MDSAVSAWPELDLSPETVFEDAKQAAFRGQPALCLEDPCSVMEAAGLEPDPWQRDLLRSDWRRALLLCSRQAGKSTTTGALGLHAAMHRPDTEVMIVSPSRDQSTELLRRTMELYYEQEAAVEAEAESMTRIVFANGSRILSLPGTPRAVRGYTADLLIIDEAAWVLDEVYGAADPMLAVTGGRLVALSTPWGRRGWFFREWTEGGAGWHRVKVTAYDCPRITAEFLEERRRSMPAMVFASEYECKFTDTIDSLFRTEDIERAFTGDVQPLFTKRFLP